MTESAFYSWSDLIGACTLAVVAIYARLTARIASAAAEQSEAPQKPCLVVEIPDELTAAGSGRRAYDPRAAAVGPTTLWVRNIGSGPALNATLKVTGSPEPAWSPALPPLAAGEPWNTGYSVTALPDEAFVALEYESLSSTRYRTSGMILKHRWVGGFRFERLSPIPPPWRRRRHRAPRGAPDTGTGGRSLPAGGSP